MTTQNKEAHPFWSGFTVGAIVGTGLMYFVGTKKGRETVHRVLENTEDFEQSIQQILNFLRTNDIVENMMDSNKDENNSLNTIIDKMTHYNSDDSKTKNSHK